MKLLKIILLSLTLVSFNCFAYDASRCMSVLVDPATSKQLTSKGMSLSELVSYISNQAKVENYYKDSNLLAPLSMTASQSGMASTLTVEFVQLVKLNFLNINSDESAVVHRLLVNSLNIFIKNNETFLVYLNSSIDSSSSARIRSYLEEARTTIFEINYLLSSCKR